MRNCELYELIGGSPGYAVAYNGRGWAYFSQGNYHKAITLMHGYAEALAARASAYLGKYAEAFKDCEQAILLKPELIWALFNI